MFDLDQFIADCRTAIAQDSSHKAVRDVVARAVSDPAAVLKTIGEPSRAAIRPLYRSSDLTILNVIWPASFTRMPHDHQMWAVIGVYTGREDNIFWRRLPEGANGKVEAAGARAICAKDAYPLGSEIIHSVTNPLTRLTGSLQVYGGDLYGVIRSEWDAETLCEQRVQAAPSTQLFEAADARTRL
jgi:predicted metal-dependent enzyme (double-stranded beta helix superfamily)